MTTYKLIIPRRCAALYYAWEFGNRPVAINKVIDQLPRDVRGWVEISVYTLMRPVSAKRWTRRALENFASRIREAIAYQEGRLGKPFSAGGGCVCVTPEEKP